MTSLFTTHSPGLVLTAVFVCVTMASVLVYLLERIRRVRGRRRLWSAGIATVVAGVGVWTTHFVAMLGFRPDVTLGYDASITVASLVISILFVGAPLSFSAMLESRWKRAAVGSLAGGGVGAMHFTGMAALQGCLTSYSTALTTIAIGSGMLAFAASSVVPGRRWHAAAKAALLVAGIATPHFTAMAGLTLEAIPGAAAGAVEPITLSAFVALAALMLFVIALVLAVGGAKFDERTRIEERMQAEHLEMLSAALNHMSNGLLKVSGNRTIDLYNEQMRTLLRLEAGDVWPKMPLETFLRNVGLRCGWDEARIRRTIVNHGTWMERSSLTRIEHSFDDGRVLSIVCRPVGDGGAIITYDDVTADREFRAEIQHMAFHDALTGLPNRRRFKDTIVERLTGTDLTCVLMLDLDRFKSVNDTLGHAMGDHLLVHAADRMRSVCGPSDALFRLGGDEVAIIPEDAAAADTLAARLVAAFRKPFLVEGHVISIGCSVGIAKAGPQETPDLLIQKSDLALYKAKANGRSCVAAYAEGMMEEAAERRVLEEDLQRAIECSEFRLVYQPLFELPSRRLTGFEALIRWDHPTRGVVSPIDFIPLSEENGLINQIGKWVIDEACRQLAVWPTDIHVAINVSAVQMRSADMLRQIVQALDVNGLSPNRLELEMTETAMVDDAVQIAVTLMGLRALGVKISMDDFGTGYSSLAHLRDFELDRIKIDRSFVDAAPDDLGAQAVLRAVTAMARELSITTVAEGVENREQLERLTALGCDAAQGYLLGRPMDKESASRIIDDRETTPPVALSA